MTSSRDSHPTVRRFQMSLRQLYLKHRCKSLKVSPTSICREVCLPRLANRRNSRPLKRPLNGTTFQELQSDISKNKSSITSPLRNVNSGALLPPQVQSDG